MCGITGFKNYSSNIDLKQSLEKGTHQLSLRGPDNQATFFHESIGLGHTRLSIIDTSDKANQPMTDQSGRYTLVFNGEIYNYRELSKTIDVDLTTSSDTEVLLHLLIEEGENCLTKLNGFFAFAFYDTKEETMLLARDRIGIKSLHYYQNSDFFAFGSEMKALFSFPIPRKINHQALQSYLRFTYLPQTQSMVNGVKKLLPGHYMKVYEKELDIKPYWKLKKLTQFTGDYDSAKYRTVSLLEESVQRRMVADVPLGSFLSGGTDSSAVVSMAVRFNPNIHTFSIGYKDHSFFDETNYAELVAEKFKTNHTTFSLTNDDLLDSLPNVLDYIDEPFADSSAIPTYILSDRVSKKMKVALSGDGADELFGGYYKHLAFSNSLNRNGVNFLIKHLGGSFKYLPKSRSSFLGNQIRRISKYADLLNLKPSDRYVHLASFNQNPGQYLLKSNHLDQNRSHDFHSSCTDLNSFLDQDLQMVLPGDMLTKVDLMSMANSLEVRVPFLDPDLVNFTRSLPPHFKVSGNKRKMILQDAFEHILPKELHHRSKKGFEVPLLSWLRNELNQDIEAEVFNTDYLKHQNLFDADSILSLRNQLYSNNPGDVHSIVWSIYVFQKWYKKWME